MIEMTEQFSAQSFRLIGEQMIGRKGGRFEAHFKISPRLCAKTYRLIKYDVPSLQPRYLLWCLKLMFAYGKTESMADFAGVHRDTFGPRAWQVMEAIANQLPNVVS